MPGQTVQTLRSSLIRVYTVCHSVCIVSTHYSIVEPHSSNFTVITTNVLGVRIFRKFTVCKILMFVAVIKENWYFHKFFPAFSVFLFPIP